MPVEGSTGIVDACTAPFVSGAMPVNVADGERASLYVVSSGFARSRLLMASAATSCMSGKTCE
jgi:hypothetical protein